MTAPDVNADVRASERLREVIAFLLGEAPLDGCWFGEKPENERGNFWWRKHLRAAHADMAGEVRELVEALHEGRRAIGDHYAPNDCYATGPLTGDPIRDLVQCPACSFIGMYEAALAKFHPTHQEKP
jgi:hypothetical protein